MLIIEQPERGNSDPIVVPAASRARLSAKLYEKAMTARTVRSLIANAWAMSEVPLLFMVVRMKNEETQLPGWLPGIDCLILTYEGRGVWASVVLHCMPLTSDLKENIFIQGMKLCGKYVLVFELRETITRRKMINRCFSHEQRVVRLSPRFRGLFAGDGNRKITAGVNDGCKQGCRKVINLS